MLRKWVYVHAAISRSLSLSPCVCLCISLLSISQITLFHLLLPLLLSLLLLLPLHFIISYKFLSCFYPREHHPPAVLPLCTYVIIHTHTCDDTYTRSEYILYVHCTRRWVHTSTFACKRSLFSSFQAFHEAIYFSRAQSTFSALTYFCFVYTENCLYSEYKQMAVVGEREREPLTPLLRLLCYMLRNAHICLSISKVAQ